MTVVHLFSGDQVARMRRYSTGVTVCGQLVAPTACLDDDPAYCTDCVSATFRWHLLVDKLRPGGSP